MDRHVHRRVHVAHENRATQVRRSTLSAEKGVLFVSYKDTLDLLSVDEAFEVCEQVYRMHAEGSVVLSTPPSFKLDVGEEFNNHWHVKSALLKAVPTTGVRLYNYYDDGVRNTVGSLDCARYIMLSDPHTGEPVSIVDEHWSYVIRSAASAVLACKWLGPAKP
jgi:ornithine cyclodeaminase/alanine dehydrogenase-like protein (mu-crystallin family)